MKYDEDELSCSLDVSLKRVADKIAVEIKRVRQGKYGVYCSDIVNYVNGHGDWDFGEGDESYK